MLQQFATLLYVKTEIHRADFLVLLRGDKEYFRALEAVRLFKEGYASFIYISMALEDNTGDILSKYGVHLPTEQERLRSVLIQSGIPDQAIIIGTQEPGGGTYGEITRVANVMKKRGFVTAIVVTNWWHSLRTKLICNRILEETNFDVRVSSAIEDHSNPSNWWHYRYTAIRILEEIPKLAVLAFSPSSTLKFHDDPNK